MKYVLDTNIITAILKGHEGIKQKFQKLLLEGREFFINGISYYEIKRGLLAANATTQLKRFEQFCEELGLLLPDAQKTFDIASEIYADLKRKGQLMEDADILIASIVLCKDLILVSNDTDFQRIERLKVENWSS